MAETAPRILEGVFAISKPPSLSSAQVLRDLQTTFAASQTFAPLLADTRHKQDEQERHQSKRRRKSNDAPFKMGHGGTLDPLATGVLIVGLGRGTKHLQNFLGCTKTYDTVVLFGKSTDTYDIAGKIVGEADFKHITKELVESKLDQFRGKIRQVPPIYSALKINGMKAYEYARGGKELPRELESREMQVDECTLLGWFDGGQHDFHWPAEEAPEDEKMAVSKLTGVSDSSTKLNDETLQKTKQDKPLPTTPAQIPKQNEPASPAPEVPAPESPAQRIPASPKAQNVLSPSTKATIHTHDHTLNLSPSPAPSPAARVRLTVSSGFYVRSFAHDLGHACNSQGIMASLLRSRQAIYTVTDPTPSPDQITTLTYSDLQAGEATWGPKITAQLTRWMEENPVVEAHVNGRDPVTKRRIETERPRQRFRGEWTAESKGERKRQQGGKWKGKWNEGGNQGRMHERASVQEKRERERNSSSPE